MYKDYGFYEHNDLIMKQLAKGAFLTTKVGDDVNTMTIGWGNISIVWNKRVFMVYVRYSRHTYDMLEKSNEFTLSFPINVNMKDELYYVGTNSFKDQNKIKVLGLELEDGKEIETPVIKGCDLHIECKVIYKQAMEPGLIPVNIKDRFYKDNDFHICYYGEIVSKYGDL